MPQFDSLSFFSQVFWLFVFFLAFYTLFLWEKLPTLTTLLKSRGHKENLTGVEGVETSPLESNRRFEDKGLEFFKEEMSSPISKLSFLQAFNKN
uniref:Atp8 n=1 Tax=Schizocladia ischiensis TaxID=196139 RepID=A0A7S6ZPD0_9STRA|nr:Atp8 [Schizocladia ischiensis]QOW07603.1 Atp8 [Schizocladia ischiensis]